MDDVLLLSTSPFAVRYIHQRLFEAKEFERIGYFANAKKMVRIAERREDGQIPWCGMVLHVSGGVSLDWSRLHSSFQQLSLLQQDLCGGGLGAPRRAGSAEELLGALLAVDAFVVKNVLTSRFSNPFLLSPSLNSVNRILQNYFELGVCWSRCIALKMLWYFRVNVLSAHFSAGPLVRAFARRVFLSVKKVVARLKADVNTHPFDFATIESCVVFSFWNEVTSLLGGCFSDAPSAMEMGEMKPLYDAARARLDSFFPLGR
ncbi:hypothetical protein AGDE_16124 [Angomonas deanei]|uniref:Reverse transcriptase domain-containing protein n=1 Tax=Angomonas deanei TaxID=59799 RepID=A0A7G2CRZ9_9TRYP|nr:hypothetical protein AGDE_16124 [Angomonas deanei]CAD2222305.1 hypothetical protein, conserved [Angomonas deanei]|eukprot:EPY17686.1 hypothetical protein AGDE_16124 [Angomonas deanei]